MTDALIIATASNEVQKRSFGTTQQFLAVHEVVYADGKPKVLRVDAGRKDGTAIVYFAVKDEKFYFAVYLETVPGISVSHTGTEPFHSVSFRAASETLSLEQLSAFSKLAITGGWNKGDQRKTGTSSYKYSAVHFEPNPEPDAFDDKLMKLLAFLEQDRQGTSQLVEQANGYVQVASIFHNGNTMLGGHHLDKDVIKRLGDLKLAIDFDLYAAGNFFTA
jgi:hypothetical protein